MLLGKHVEGKTITYEKINSYEYVPVFIIRDTEEMFNMRSEEVHIENHWHRSIEMIYTNQSCSDIVINGKNIHLSQDSIYIINSRDIHYIDMPNIRERYTGYTLQLSYSFLKDICPDFDDRKFYVDDKSKDYIKPILEMIIKLYFDDIIKNKEIITNLCKALLETLKTYASSINVDKNKITDKKILKILDYIDKNYNQDLNIQHLADKYNISYTYLAKLFKENLGISANQYINNLRYEKALIDISITNHTITDIAYLHGFPNVSALIREFKKNKGMSPNEYRKLID